MSIVILSIIINFGLHLIRKSKKPNVITKTQEKIVVSEKEEEPIKEKDKIIDYYNIYRKDLDRPVMFTIGNTPQALPHYGLYGAKYIYEVVAEGGITRLLAIYTKGDVEKIGPVRSARHNFFDISREYDAVIGHFGGSPKTFADIESLGLPSLNGIALDGVMYFRDKTRKAPDNAYTSSNKTIEYIKKYGYNRDVIDNHFEHYYVDTDLYGKIAKKVDIVYSYAESVRYEYDENIKVYKRFMRGKPHIDEGISSQLSAKNIIIQYAAYHSIDDENRQEIDLVGSGKGKYISNGSYIDITWKKSSRNE